ncbi:hypothetical protein A2U01_0023391, partial [Trifolium medium]|nr:hypothetical protein [Trifolium medium]
MTEDSTTSTKIAPEGVKGCDDDVERRERPT